MNDGGDAATTDVIVIGAGIGGLTAAVALQQRGIDVAVFERTAEIENVGAGISLWPNAMRILRCLHLEEAVVAAGSPLKRTEIRTRDGRLLKRVELSTMTAALGAPAVCLHRATLHSILLSALKPGTVRLGAEFLSVDDEDAALTGVVPGRGHGRPPPASAGVVARCANGEAVQGSALIGADGLRSAVRSHVFGKTPVHYAGFHAWRGIATMPALFHEGVTQEWWGLGMRFGVVPIGPSQVYWYATRNRTSDTTAGVGRSELLEAFRDWGEPTLRTIVATPEAAILHHAMYDIDPLPHWGRGRVTLLGDAAHAMTPNLGQGACQAIEDAWTFACCWNNSDWETALRRYEGFRRGRTRKIARISRNLGTITQWGNPAMACTRNAVVAATPSRALCDRMTRLFAYDPEAVGAALDLVEH